MRKINKIAGLFFMPLTDRHKEMLKAAAPDAEWIFSTPSAFELAEIADADVLLGDIKSGAMGQMPRLRYYHTASSGVDAYLAALPGGVLFTNSTGVYGQGIGEHMLAMLMALMYRLHLYRDNQSGQVWERMGQVDRLRGSTVLVLGLGDIGGSFAEKARGLGANVIGIRRREAPKPDCVDEVYTFDRLDEVLPRADVVALALPNTKETARVMDADRIGRMKQGAYLLNVGRGSAIDSYAMVDALNREHLAGAGLDVTDPEPLPAEHPLWLCRNAIITPHTSGYYYDTTSVEKLVELCADNLRRYQREEPLLNPVDLTAGYRTTTSS